MEEAAQCPPEPGEEDTEIAILRRRGGRAREQLAGQIGDQPDDARLGSLNADRKLRIARKAFAHRGDRQGRVDCKDMVERLVLEVGEAGLFGRMGDLQDELALAFGLDVEIVVAFARQRTRGAGQPVVSAQQGQCVGDRNVRRVLGERFAESIGH